MILSSIIYHFYWMLFAWNQLAGTECNYRFFFSFCRSPIHFELCREQIHTYSFCQEKESYIWPLGTLEYLISKQYGIIAQSRSFHKKQGWEKCFDFISFHFSLFFHNYFFFGKSRFNKCPVSNKPRTVNVFWENDKRTCLIIRYFRVSLIFPQ